MKILFAEDDPFLSKELGMYLKTEGISSSVVVNGQEALDAMRSSKPDVLLLDIDMPVKNGWDVLEEMRADEDLKDIHVIMLSNSSGADNMSKAVSLGAPDYFVKANTDLDVLLQTLLKWKAK